MHLDWRWYLISDIDLTDYVNVGARAWVEATTALDWDKIPEIHETATDKHDLRNMVLPIVSAVIEEYKKNHPETDLGWLEGIG